MAKKICFVVQRYGLEVNGGAELEARLLAEHMAEHGDDIHVLTSKAIDYTSWKNEYEADLEEINGVTVHRFPVEHERSRADFDRINQVFLSGALDPSREADWLEAQGPYAPQLIEYLKEHRNDYDAFVFFTYLYYPTAMGIKEVSERSITVPTAHDEPFLKMSIFDDVFTSPKAILYNTDEEKEFVQSKYRNESIPNRVGATGVEAPADIDPLRFKKKYSVDDFLIYVGRIDDGKNCSQLFDYFIEFKHRNPSDLKLLLLGKEAMPIPNHEDIIPLGFVEERDKFDGMKAAEALILPSVFESLSFVVIESMLMRTPVLVNGKSPVLKGHCLKSNGALYYDNYLEFERMLKLILNAPQLMTQLTENAYGYADCSFTWKRAVGNLAELIEFI